MSAVYVYKYRNKVEFCYSVHDILKLQLPPVIGQCYFLTVLSNNIAVCINALKLNIVCCGMSV